MILGYQVLAANNGVWLVDLKGKNNQKNILLIDTNGKIDIVSNCSLAGVDVHVFPRNTNYFLWQNNFTVGKIRFNANDSMHVVASFSKYSIAAGEEQVNHNNSRMRTTGTPFWNPPGDVVFVATTITPKDPSTDLDIIVDSFWGKSSGIAFWGKEHGIKFINPDESKKWILACLSVDERTCLAVHQTGGVILDNPFN